MRKFIVSRDDNIYEAFPDVALTATGRLVCVFSECTHHRDRSYTCIMATTSDDRGRTWSAKRRVTEALRGDPKVNPYWNCARVSALSDGRLAVAVDRICGRSEGERSEQSNWLFFSEDNGESFSGPQATPVEGIVPDQLIELQHGDHRGRWLLGAHHVAHENGGNLWRVRTWHSDDQGRSWQGPFVVAAEPELMLCEGSIVELPTGELACFLRENSGRGLDAFKTISRDGGATWGPVTAFPLPGCHRPVAGMLANGLVLITHRFMQGGKGWIGWWTQNTFAGLTDVESVLAEERQEAHSRILPLDFDRHRESDTGYTGWVQFDDGEVYVVNYIMDDAPKAHIRGYAVSAEAFRLPA